MHRKYFISKAFTLFCREFENVANCGFLVLIFWVKNLGGAYFYAFRNFDCAPDSLRFILSNFLLFESEVIKLAKQTWVGLGTYYPVVSEVWSS